MLTYQANRVRRTQLLFKYQRLMSSTKYMYMYTTFSVAQREWGVQKYCQNFFSHMRQNNLMFAMAGDQLISTVSLATLINIRSITICEKSINQSSYFWRKSGTSRFHTSDSLFPS